MIKLVIDGKDLTRLMTSSPKITDHMDAACRTLELEFKKANDVAFGNGQLVQLYVGTVRWFLGFVRNFNIAERTEIVKLKAYDPAYFLSKTPDDYYFKDQTCTQITNTLAAKAGVRVKKLESTETVFTSLHYDGAEADKVIVDTITRTYRSSGRKFWYRYDPDSEGDGLVLFERSVPETVWLFQPGNNLTDATYSESVEDTRTIVKLVNRETGKTVTKIDSDGVGLYGPTVAFVEVGKDEADNMEALATQRLEELSKVKVEMGVAGVNAGIKMPMFYSGDVIYVAAEATGIVGAYHIKNVTQDIVSSEMVRLDFDVVLAPDIPAIQYDDAAKAVKSKKKNIKAGSGVQQSYNDEVKAAIAKYGID